MDKLVHQLPMQTFLCGIPWVTTGATPTDFMRFRKLFTTVELSGAAPDANILSDFMLYLLTAMCLPS